MEGTESAAIARRVDRVPLVAWAWCADINGYSAPGGWQLRKCGQQWAATLEGAEMARDEYLSNVMMGLCG